MAPLSLGHQTPRIILHRGSGSTYAGTRTHFVYLLLAKFNTLRASVLYFVQLQFEFLHVSTRQNDEIILDITRSVFCVRVRMMRLCIDFSPVLKVTMSNIIYLLKYICMYIWCRYCVPQYTVSTERCCSFMHPSFMFVHIKHLSTPPLQDLHRPSIPAQLQCTYNGDTKLPRRTNQPLLLCKICTFDQFLTNQSAQAHPASARELTHRSLGPDEDTLVASKGLGKWVINPLHFTFNTQKRSLPLHICECFMHTQMFYV